MRWVMARHYATVVAVVGVASRASLVEEDAPGDSSSSSNSTTSSISDSGSSVVGGFSVLVDCCRSLAGLPAPIHNLAPRSPSLRLVPRNHTLTQQHQSPRVKPLISHVDECRPCPHHPPRASQIAPLCPRQ